MAAADPSGAHGDLVALLRELHSRSDNPLSHRAVGERAGVSWATVSNALDGPKVPGPDDARAIAAALGATSDEQQQTFEYAEQAWGARPARRSGPSSLPYRYQIERLAPSALNDRDDELRELADFCRGAGAADYVWWQGPPWSGKTALMSRFVLEPPEGVRLVSFFVTARLAGQATRAAFVEAVGEQLAAILDEPPPRDLTETAREANLLRLLAEAPRRCLGRLALVVDGLDEERRLDEHSIAGLLPSRPRHGLRIVVAGRRHPTVPDDVPLDHPLRDPAIVRPLTIVEAAKAIRFEAERDLKRVLADDGPGRRLLGLITAAGGGLTADDLTDLSDVDFWTVEDHLKSLRIYQRSSGDAYQLAHEELVVEATRLLAARLREPRGQLLDWANRYRSYGWPAETPSYLLYEYVPMLYGTGDLEAVVPLVTDTVLYDRVLEETGGDAIALRDLAFALRLAVIKSDPGIVCLLRLHQQRIIARNVHIPVGLPALWAALGRLDRAVALADSLRDDIRRKARVEIGSALVRTARLTEAETWAASLDTDRERLLRRMAETALTSEARALVVRLAGDGHVVQKVIRTAVATGDVAGAEELLARYPGNAVETVAPALAAAGRIDEAEAMARAVGNPRVRATALHGVAHAVAGSGDVDRAASVADAVPSPYGHRTALIMVARRLAATGHLDEAITYARGLDEAIRPHLVLTIAAGLLSRTGITDPESVTVLAGQVTAQYPRPEIVEHVADLLGPGRPLAEAAFDLLAEDGTWLDALLARLATDVAQTEGVAPADQYSSAMSVARLVPNDETRARTLKLVAQLQPHAAANHTAGHTQETMVAVALRLATAGCTGEATRLAHELTENARQQREATVEPTERPTLRSSGRLRPPRDITLPAALISDPDALVEHVRSQPGHPEMVDTLLAAIEALAEAGNADVLVHFARQIVGQLDEFESGYATVEALTTLGALDSAEEFARHAPRSEGALANVAEAHAERGDLDRAEGLADEIGSAHLFGDIAQHAADHGDVSRAHRLLARAIADSDWQDWLHLLERMDPSAADRVRNQAERLDAG
jgi:hypothetical protein